jgi:hypothetical protein
LSFAFCIAVNSKLLFSPEVPVTIVSVGNRSIYISSQIYKGG